MDGLDHLAQELCHGAAPLPRTTGSCAFFKAFRQYLVVLVKVAEQDVFLNCMTPDELVDAKLLILLKLRDWINCITCIPVDLSVSRGRPLHEQPH
jgi:hypothetical protein